MLGANPQGDPIEGRPAGPLPRRSLGELEVASIGFGGLALTRAYGPVDETQSIAAVHRAIDLGLELFDTADVYGPFISEQVLGRALAGRRRQVVVATKFGNQCLPDGRWLGLNGRPDYVAQALEASLGRLGVDAIDLYYLHRVDPAVPIEDTWGAMADLVSAGKVRHLGLSEVSAATLRRAHRIHPVAAVQSEYSLFSREPEAAVLPTCRELGIGFVAYCPLSRGLLAGGIGAEDRFASGDNRAGLPRFSPEHLGPNAALGAAVAAMARRKGTSAAQLALAWLLAQGSEIVPIPGMTTVAQVEENAGAADWVLEPGDLAELEELVPPGAVHGERFGPEMLATVEQ